ncbi:glycoside hydrolase/deacetylase [Neurospora crassa]|nr:glycoside hydrolase/deacetylase [Neurospora crassa]
MKLSSALLAASLGLTFAHDTSGGQHVPKALGGRNFLSELKALRSGPMHAATPLSERAPTPKQKYGPRKRDADDQQCGPGLGSCAAGKCCSFEGWCGVGEDYCTAPDCQINYGPGCDGNQKPSGPDTSGVARPKVGKVLYGGGGIYDCVIDGGIALTFDDGPYLYTNDLLDKLKSYGAKATFFITGNNIGKGMINDPSTPYPAIIRRMHAEGHQIASHTWSHENASQLTNTQMTNQMVWNEIAFNSILGFFPTYMRPPYSICGKNCQNVLSTLGYHAIYFDLDTEGYLHDDARQIQTSKNIWDKAIKNTNPAYDSFLQIEHDIHVQTVYNLTDYILTSLFSKGYSAVTVGECLGDPAENWYRTGPAVPSLSSTSSSVRTTTSTTSIKSSSTSTSIRTTTRSTVLATSTSTSTSIRTRSTGVLVPPTTGTSTTSTSIRTRSTVLVIPTMSTSTSSTRSTITRIRHLWLGVWKFLS